MLFYELLNIHMSCKNKIICRNFENKKIFRVSLHIEDESTFSFTRMRSSVKMVNKNVTTIFQLKGKFLHSRWCFSNVSNHYKERIEQNWARNCWNLIWSTSAAYDDMRKFSFSEFRGNWTKSIDINLFLNLIKIKFNKILRLFHLTWKSKNSFQL